MPMTGDELGDNEREWPVRLGDGATVRGWIAEVLPGQQQVLGPLATLQGKQWGVTATFIATGNATPVGPASGGGKRSHANAQPTDVVFKASWLPLFRGAPLVYDVLSRACPGMVPELLAWQHRAEDETWALFRAFAGTAVATLPRTRRAQAIAETARTLARIQAAVATLPAAKLATLPRHDLAGIPAQFEVVVQDLRTRMLPYWQSASGRTLARRFALPLDGLLERVERQRSAIVAWTAELCAGSWPLTLDHVDLHTDNVAQLADGQVVLHDWEEANLSSPFFSLDRLLDDARALDAPCGRRAAGAYSPDIGKIERTVREAYLEALPWQSRAQRERALEVALCLAPIKAAYEGVRFADALGWREGMPLVSAWAIDRALARWAMPNRNQLRAPISG